MPTEPRTEALSPAWDALWEELRHHATGRPSGIAIIQSHRAAIEAEARRDTLTEPTREPLRTFAGHYCIACNAAPCAEATRTALEGVAERVGRIHRPTEDTDYVAIPPITEDVCMACEVGDGYEKWPCRTWVALLSTDRETTP